MAWTTTPPTAGPLGTNNYTQSITGLSASSKYRYRAYFIVAGFQYFGDILTGTTAAIAIVPPTMTTGLADTPTASSFNVNNNEVDDKGGAPVVEYGVLYTQLGFYGTVSNLTYGNIGAHVSKVSNFEDIIINTPYSESVSGLAENTTTYYRAFAKTAGGVGYGTIKTEQTVAILSI